MLGKKTYLQLVISTCSTIKKSSFSDIWKAFSVFIISTSLTLNVLTIWMVIYHFIAPGFTDFFVIKAIPYKIAVYIYILGYVFLPILIFNIIYLYGNNIEILIEENAKSANKKYFRIHFFSSYFLAYLVLMLVL